MKKYLFLTLLLFHGTCLISQSILSNDLPGNEIGLNIFSLLPTPEYDFLKFEYEYTPTYLGGIFYKRYIKNKTLRVYISYRNIHNGPTRLGDWMRERQYNEGILKFGVHKQIVFFKSKAIIPYIGSDLLLEFINFEKVEGGGFMGFYTLYNKHSKGIGVSPIIGFQTNLFKKFAISVETSIDLILSRNEISTAVHQYGDEISNRNSHETDFVNFWNPISICSVNYRF